MRSAPVARVGFGFFGSEFLRADQSEFHVVDFYQQKENGDEKRTEYYAPESEERYTHENSENYYQRMRVGHFAIQYYSQQVVHIGDDEYAARHEQYALPYRSVDYERYSERNAHYDRADHRNQSRYGGEECPESYVLYAEQPVYQCRRQALSEHYDRNAYGVAVDDAGYFFYHHILARTFERAVTAYGTLHGLRFGEHEVQDYYHEKYVDDETVGGIDDRAGGFAEVRRVFCQIIVRYQVEGQMFVYIGHYVVHAGEYVGEVQVDEFGCYYTEYSEYKSGEDYCRYGDEQQRCEPRFPMVFVDHCELPRPEDYIQRQRSEQGADQERQFAYYHRTYQNQNGEEKHLTEEQIVFCDCFVGSGHDASFFEFRVIAYFAVRQFRHHFFEFVTMQKLIQIWLVVIRMCRFLGIGGMCVIALRIEGCENVADICDFNKNRIYLHSDWDRDVVQSG